MSAINARINSAVISGGGVTKIRMGSVYVPAVNRRVKINSELLSRIVGLPCKYLLERLGTGKTDFDASFVGKETLGNILKDNRGQLGKDDLSVYELSKEINEDPLFFLHYFVDGNVLPRDFIQREIEVSDNVTAPIFNIKDVERIKLFVRGQQVNPDKVRAIIQEMRAIVPEGESEDYDAHFALLENQADLVYSYAKDLLSTRNPLTSFEQYSVFNKLVVENIHSLQRKFMGFLGIPDQFKFLHEITIHGFFGEQKKTPLVEFVEMLKPTGTEGPEAASRVEFHRLLTAYLLQSGDIESLSLTHYLLKKVDSNELQTSKDMINELARISCLLPLRHPSINLVIPEIKDEAPQKEAPKTSETKLQSISNIVEKTLYEYYFLSIAGRKGDEVKQKWGKGGYKAKVYEEFVNEFLKRQTGPGRGGICHLLADYHPGIFVKIIEDEVDHRGKEIGELKLTDFIKNNKLKKNIVAVILSLVYICEMYPIYASKGIDFGTLYLRLKNLTDNFNERGE